ncbi:hypothetical protein RB596_007446 [Gaeumannomyces avenae]
MSFLDSFRSRVQGGSKSVYKTICKLTQEKTNGKSRLGTFLAPLLPVFLSNNPLPHGRPWGDKTIVGTNPYHDCPTTGVIRSYDFTLSRATIAPDGYEVPALLVNGAFPGPTIEANWGDTIQVTVHNNITGPEEGTAIHWHGLLQRGTPWEDGVPGVSQCAIAPQKLYTYQFRADMYGTSWYHSHFSAQYSGGIFGPMVIYGPEGLGYDVDLGPVMLTDWYHKGYLQIIEEMLAPNGSPRVFSDNNLINGKNNFDCTKKDAGDNTKCTSNAGISKFKFQTGKTHRLRLINSGADGVQRFSIDQHTMTVIANDFVPIKPYDAKVVTLGVGQRVDVIVKADAGASKSAYWMRSNLTSCTLARQPLAVAAIYYDEDTGADPTSTPWDVADPGTCANDDLALTQPLFSIPAYNPSYDHTFNVELFRNASNVTLWKFDGVSARVNMNAPPLLLANLGNTSFPAEWNVHNVGRNTSIRMVVVNKTPASHPMHLHGANFQVLAEGVGQWDGTTVVNAQNPMRRDVQQIRGGGYLVLQFESDNAGAWPFHCHIAWHASGGFFSTFLVQPDEIKQFQIPLSVAQTCRDWAAYTQTNVPLQIDSGL